MPSPDLSGANREAENDTQKLAPPLRDLPRRAVWEEPGDVNLHMKKQRESKLLYTGRERLRYGEGAVAAGEPRGMDSDVIQRSTEGMPEGFRS